ncbi:hypothetical protein FHP25_08730 [Vineibacter terrae]|uniref:Uncharacterized protein n=1 Tax=Vineibacter terrae TaxID=2586908 RepID=A0A5C8PRT3_9HYPH|nr:hypothetical protein [Vineibacter terrae]TXL78263.1 hypothetical protein FHP25_08730 [Vineibacter terrae]
MTSAIIAKVGRMEAKDLKTLEDNVRRILEKGSQVKKAEASAVLAAINEEWKRREREEHDQRQAAKDAVRDKVKDLGLFDRVVQAFEKECPSVAEAKVLKTIAGNPDLDFHTLAVKVGYRDGAVINRVVGGMCKLREAFLGKAPPSQDRPGEPFYSGLIIDMTPHKRPDGTTWHGWSLKVEAEAALRHLKIIGGRGASTGSA